MAGGIVIAVVLLLIPVVVAMSGAVLAAILGVALKRDRDAAFEGTEYLALSDANPYATAPAE